MRDCTERQNRGNTTTADGALEFRLNAFGRIVSSDRIRRSDERNKS